MQSNTGTITTTIISSENKPHVYEIIREFSEGGQEIILLTLFPTLTEPNTLDVSSMHMINHAADSGLKIGRIHFV